MEKHDLDGVWRLRLWGKAKDGEGLVGFFHFKAEVVGRVFAFRVSVSGLLVRYSGVQDVHSWLCTFASSSPYRSLQSSANTHSTATERLKRLN